MLAVHWDRQDIVELLLKNTPMRRDQHEHFRQVQRSTTLTSAPSHACEHRRATDDDDDVVMVAPVVVVCM
eukprot:2066341-Rhodomonas_salina.1